MILLSWLIKIFLAVGMIGFVIIVLKAIIELCRPPKKQQTNITINFFEADPNTQEPGKD